MKIKVYNDPEMDNNYEKVFDGELGEYLQINEFDENIVAECEKLKTNDIITMRSFSGDWIIVKEIII